MTTSQAADYARMGETIRMQCASTCPWCYSSVVSFRQVGPERTLWSEECPDCHGEFDVVARLEVECIEFKAKERR